MKRCIRTGSARCALARRRREAHPPAGYTVMSHLPQTNLKPKEAALLAGEIEKPSWESRNEGIHERVSFEDTIWGFDLAGGAYYKTPLRVTSVKPDSRAEKAGIRPGDRLLRINDIDTSQLTIQEAHDIIKESGIHLRLAVTAPEDLEDSYHCWEDPIEDDYDSEEERRIEREKAAKRAVRCRTNNNWSLQWPWVSKRRIIYKESNCYLVPSKYESKHRDKFLTQIQGPKAPEDIVLYSKNCEKKKLSENDKSNLENNKNLNKELENPLNGSMKNGTNKVSSNNNDTMNIAAGELGKIREESEEDTTLSDGDTLEEVLQTKGEISKEEEDQIIEDILENKEESPNTNSETLEVDKT